jgi:hypothetical protein
MVEELEFAFSSLEPYKTPETKCLETNPAKDIRLFTSL